MIMLMTTIENEESNAAIRTFGRGERASSFCIAARV